MSVTVINIIPAKQVESVQTTQYTVSSVKTIIDKFTITNTSSSNVIFNCNLVINDGSVSNSNNILNDRVILPDETYTCPELVGHSLESGSFISTLASASNSLTIRASGREIS